MHLDAHIAELERRLQIPWIGNRDRGFFADKNHVVWTHPFYVSRMQDVSEVPDQTRQLLRDYAHIPQEWFTPSHVKRLLSMHDPEAMAILYEKQVLEGSACDLAIVYAELDLMRSIRPDTTITFLLGSSALDLTLFEVGRGSKQLAFLKSALGLARHGDHQFALSFNYDGTQLAPRQGNFGYFTKPVHHSVAEQKTAFQQAFSENPDTYHVGTTASRCVKHSMLSSSYLGGTAIGLRPFIFETKSSAPGIALNESVRNLVPQLPWAINAPYLLQDVFASTPERMVSLRIPPDIMPHRYWHVVYRHNNFLCADKIESQ